MPRVLGVLVLFVLSCFGLTDGKYFASSTRPEVDIPYQRAAIHFHNGVQTMGVQSLADGEGPMSWVVPVPSEKAEVWEGRQSAGRFGMMYRTKLFARTESSGLELSLIAVVCALIWVATLAWAIQKKRPGWVYGWIFVTGYLMPALAVSGAAAVPSSKGASSTDAVKSFQTENFRAELIRSNDVAGLRAWLAKNGTPMTPDVEPVLADYLREGWRFLAVHVVKRSRKPEAPNVLTVRFPTAAPVYPMRLTAFGAKSLVLDLLVWNEKAPLAVKGMAVVESIRESNALILPNLEPDYRLDFPRMEGWQTRLRGVFKPSQMKEDLTFEPIPAVEVSRMVVSWPVRARNVAGTMAFCLWMGALAALVAPPLRRTALAFWVGVALSGGGLFLLYTFYANGDFTRELTWLLSGGLLFSVIASLQTHKAEDAMRRSGLILMAALLVGLIAAVSTDQTSWGAAIQEADGSISGPGVVYRG